MKKMFLILLIILCSCSTKTEIIYKSVYPSLPQLESPLILSTFPCKFSVPQTSDTNIFIGFDKENFKCYLKNQEINREQKLIYEKFIKEINSERDSWNKMNKEK